MVENIDGTIHYLAEADNQSRPETVTVMDIALYQMEEHVSPAATEKIRLDLWIDAAVSGKVPGSLKLIHHTDDEFGTKSLTVQVEPNSDRDTALIHGLTQQFAQAINEWDSSGDQYPKSIDRFKKRYLQ